ncbi:putative hemerythrin HHE cation binding domain protein [Abiotrophia defectiva ATCC 49176]|uniref:Hemerythrin HHE cation binding domain protein n=2 Tax=Abiotrophia defectiva TaxID=46125 RepID=W1Q2P7_ABIDE|nr:putative hemerythrin HHE cation binding domain protein [Abiotrophia defectiva ATCC 49176]
MIMTNSSRDQRIQVLKDILLRLHHGASSDSVEADFQAHFSDVSPIEVSLMEHELMNGDHGVGFEDVMKLCTVHAKVMAAGVQGKEVPDSQQEGHPVWIFKQENLALQAGLHRIQRLLDALESAESQGQDLDPGLLRGLTRQYQLLDQFQRHYRRKEELFFPIMESYGHDAPPKVMWGVDDQIRDLFGLAKEALKGLVDQTEGASVAQVLATYQAFVQEFKDMIFKEEAILIPLLLSLFSEDDWLAIAKDSPEFGYTIIQPDKEWVPSRVKFGEQGENGDVAGAGREAQAPGQAGQPAQTQPLPGADSWAGAGQGSNQASGPAAEPAVNLGAGSVSDPSSTSTAGPTAKPADNSAADSATSPAPNPEADLPFGGGYLSLKEANLILNHLPFEITFIDKNDLFKYFNTSMAIENKLFPRVPSAIGRHVKMCHPPRSLDMVMTLIDDLKHKRRASESMWFHRSDGRFAYVTYIGVFDDQDQYMGVLEYVHDIAPLLDLGPDKRGLAPLEGDGEQAKD